MDRRWSALVAVALVGPGCLGAPAADPTTAAGSDRAFPVEDTWRACDSAAIAFFHEIDEVADLLPDGWTPGDAQVLLGTPEPTGRTLAGVFVGDCADVALAGGPMGAVDLFVLVESPTVVGADPGRSFRDFYLLVEYTDTPTFVEFLQEVGVVGALADVDTEMTFTQDTASFETTVSDGSGEVLAIGTSLAAAPFSDQSPGSRFWQEVAGGLAFYEISFPETPFSLGPLTTCRTRTGTVAHELLGSDCTGDESFALLVEGLDFPYTFHHLPGAHVE